MTLIELTLVVLLVATVGLGALLVGRVRIMGHRLSTLDQRVAETPNHLTSTLQAVQMVQAQLAEHLGRTAMGVESLMPTVSSLRQELRTLAAQELERASRASEHAEVLKRLELVIAGGTRRGAAGENILGEVLSLLPPGLLDTDVRIDGKVVELALRLPGDKFLPIDSKWPDSSSLVRLESEEDPRIRGEITRRIEKSVLARAMEVARYLNPDRTLMLGVAAVPDAVYQASTRAHAEAYRHGIIIIPYSLAVPYVLSVLVLAWRFGQALDLSTIKSGLARVSQHLEGVLSIVESHLARAATMTENATVHIRREVVDAQRAIESIGVRDQEINAPGAERPKPVRSA